MIEKIKKFFRSKKDKEWEKYLKSQDPKEVFDAISKYPEAFTEKEKKPCDTKC